MCLQVLLLFMYVLKVHYVCNKVYVLLFNLKKILQSIKFKLNLFQFILIEYIYLYLIWNLTLICAAATFQLIRFQNARSF